MRRSKRRRFGIHDILGIDEYRANAHGDNDLAKLSADRARDRNVLLLARESRRSEGKLRKAKRRKPDMDF